MTSFLTLLARLTLWRYQPRMVAVTGNAGKTSTKEAIAAVLRSKYRVRASAGNLNTDLGVAATILADVDPHTYYHRPTVLFWLGVAFRGMVGLVHARSWYPDIVVVEMAADRPGDIKRLARRYQPTVAVVTRVGAVPVHVEYFASAQHLAEEKSQLVRAVPADGLVVLNGDDLSVLDMRDRSQAPVTTFGFGQDADVQIESFTIHGARVPQGISFELTDGSTTMPIRINGALGKGLASAAASAIAVARFFHVGMADAAEALAQLQPPAGRLRILRGIKGSVIVDDSYNASPAATHLAIETMADLRKTAERGRTVLVLGDMLELGEHAVQAHQAAGNMAGDVADILVAVGERARFISDAAANQMKDSAVHWYPSSEAAAPFVQSIIAEHDRVLVKGSQGVRMERIVKEVMAEPERANDLLVRQSAHWRT